MNRENRKSLDSSGWYVRILQHEIDHLQGMLYIDRMECWRFASLDNWSRFWKGKPVRDIVEGLSNPLKPNIGFVPQFFPSRLTLGVHSTN